MKFRILLLLSLLLINPVFATEVRAAELPYTYEQLCSDITAISQVENVDIFSIGQSEYGREIYAIKIGKGELSAIIIGAAHAREWINSALIMEMAKLYANAYNNNDYAGKYYVTGVLDSCSLVFVPMQNPDGVTLQQYGLSAFTPEQQVEISQLGYSNKYKQWKANARGIDLNRQQNINWEKGRLDEPYPCYQHHKGYAPEQAAETKAIVGYIRNNQLQALISYHSTGPGIDWTGLNADYKRDLVFTNKVAAATGYRKIVDNMPVAGGLSPWFRNETGGMALTIETGRFNGENEARYSDWPAIWAQNKTVGLITANEVFNNWLNSNEKIAKENDLRSNIDGYKQNITNMNKALDDIRYLKLITGDNSVTIIQDNKILDTAFPVVIKDGLSYISIQDMGTMIESQPNAGPSGEMNRIMYDDIIINEQIYVPVRNLNGIYNISWNKNSRTILLRDELSDQ
ncbi:MAG: M14 family zinc carboxypeptidase [Syntrophomonadaceae bacterium]|jgi:g-D-glutamyl-meso-diaminopimelate peptidase